jgi:hypothetical protein
LVKLRQVLLKQVMFDLDLESGVEFVVDNRSWHMVLHYRHKRKYVEVVESLIIIVC